MFSIVFCNKNNVCKDCVFQTGRHLKRHMICEHENVAQFGVILVVEKVFWKDTYVKVLGNFLHASTFKTSIDLKRHMVWEHDHNFLDEVEYVLNCVWNKSAVL